MKKVSRCGRVGHVGGVTEAPQFSPSVISMVACKCNCECVLGSDVGFEFLSNATQQY